MSKKELEPLCSQSLFDEISRCIREENTVGGGWDWFTTATIPKLCQSYEITMQYFSKITKEHFDFVCEGIEEVVYHFQSLELVEKIEAAYASFYGKDTSTDMYRENIAGLRLCLDKSTKEK